MIYFFKFYINLPDKNKSDFITIYDEATAAYSQSILKEVEEANNDFEPTNVHGTSQIRDETEEEDFE